MVQTQSHNLPDDLDSRGLRENWKIFQEAITDLDLRDTKVHDQAEELFINLYRDDEYYGHTRNALIGAIIYVANRLAQMEDSVDESETISLNPSRAGEVVDEDKSNILAASRRIMKTQDATYVTDGYENYVSNYVEEFNLPKEVEIKANDLLDFAEEEGLTNGRSPSGLAAGAVYTATQELNETVENPPTQKEMGQTSGNSAVTIRKRYKMFKELGDE